MYFQFLFKHFGVCSLFYLFIHLLILWPAHLLCLERKNKSTGRGIVSGNYFVFICRWFLNSWKSRLYTSHVVLPIQYVKVLFLGIEMTLHFQKYILLLWCLDPLGMGIFSSTMQLSLILFKISKYCACLLRSKAYCL